MPRWDTDGKRIKQSIFDCAAFHYDVSARCRSCSHAAVLRAHALWWRFARRGWDDDLRRGASRLRCSACGETAVQLSPTRDAPTVDELPLPPEAEWKRAVNRFRN